MHQHIHIGISKWNTHRLRRALNCGGLAMAAWAGLMLCHPVAAQPLSSISATLSAPAAALVSSGPAGPTPAWIEFCARQPQECIIDASEPAVLSINQELWLTIMEVNERVNRTILAVTDQDHWAEIDRWDYPDDGLGDCEDIQLLKRKLLVEAGLPRRALRMAVVIDEQGAGHAVLMVRTDQGEFILDNKRDAVLAWHETGYHYVKREGDESATWVWLGTQVAPIVTATR
ncbi:transglutaminase-like cysteine peptidase [Microvirga arabica]|uniref:Transglutaminase-like cysteine peptidase n=1 Tax=Microvirga arabica TaxID=1128671 RepID=A0ABV6YD02_9HYPH